MHIAPFNNKNMAIVDVNDELVPLTYFNIVKLKAGEQFHYKVPGYETCIVPATGTIDVEVAGQTYEAVGNRKVDVWGGEPEAVYVPVGIKAKFTCLTAFFTQPRYINTKIQICLNVCLFPLWTVRFKNVTTLWKICFWCKFERSIFVFNKIIAINH